MLLALLLSNISKSYKKFVGRKLAKNLTKKEIKSFNTI